MKKIKLKLPRVSENAEFPLIFLLLFLPSYLNQQTLPPGIFDSPVYQLQILIQSFLILFLTLYLLGRTPPPPDDSEGPMAGEISPAGTAVTLAGLAGLFLLYNLLMRIPQLLGLPAASEEPVLITRHVMLIPAFFTCLCAAGMEEFFFRGYGYFRLLQSGMKQVPAMILINTLFAAGHLYEGLTAAGFALFSGLFLSMAMRRGISLFSLSAAHGIFNFAMILISCFG